VLSHAADDPRLAMRAFGLNFPSPVGMAAGFDKNAEVPDALLRLGFGFVEVGTITPRPQAGNPRPRLFRLDADGGVINRLGFNSQGADPVLRRLAARADAGGIVGINVGANKDSPDRIADYVTLIERFALQRRHGAQNTTARRSTPLTCSPSVGQRRTIVVALVAGMVKVRVQVPELHVTAGAAPVAAVTAGLAGTRL